MKSKTDTSNESILTVASRTVSSNHEVVALFKTNSSIGLHTSASRLQCAA